RLRRVRVTVPGTAVVLGLWAGAAVATGTLVYAEVLHPALVLVPPAGSALAVLALLRIPVYVAPPKTAPPAGAAPGSAGPGSAAPASAEPARTAAGR
ncbi:undecaprenyl/decaprenyl-phosphate alpha-N-acetylglucosaminyl 1-phosphate transferase, partial [Streptomyces fulvissimus]|nr:undecaprenyl/decaprenyl-phosphate alpha-N-acetylglucosaminyl 1-phosphate transferase [Streptomyces microflavus]